MQLARPVPPHRWLPWILLIGWLGCGDDDPSRPRPTRGVLEGQLVRVEDGQGIGPLELGLWDLERLEFRNVTRSDSSGFFRFEQIEPGDVLPVVFAFDRRTYHLPRARWRFTDAESYEITVPLAPALRWDDSGLELRGRVVDAESGEPVAGARIEMSALASDLLFSELAGRATTIEPLSDAEGRFRLAPLPQMTDPQTLRKFTPSWRVSCAGYVSQWFEGFVDGAVPASVEVRLQPGDDRFAIEGRILRLDGRPAPGIAVFAEWRRGEGALFRRAQLGSGSFDSERNGAVRVEDAASQRPRVLLPRGPVFSDQEGNYRIEGLPPGGYVVAAAALLDDGWVGTQSSGIELLSTDPDSVVGDVTLLAEPAIAHLRPPDGDTPVGLPTLAWGSVPLAAQYSVRVQRARDGLATGWSTAETQLQIEDPDFLEPGGLYLWFVRAYDAARNELSRSDRAGSFWVEP
jgi:protocatechuate 3,4-dioxygenase beta subunit